MGIETCEGGKPICHDLHDPMKVFKVDAGIVALEAGVVSDSDGEL